MESPSDKTSTSLANIVSYLFTRREAILNNWRTACEADSDLGKIASLSREEFNNLLPVVLDILEQRLLNKPLEADPTLTASSHGLHRWHKAHALLETMQELHNLGKVLYEELNQFQRLVPDTDATALMRAHRQIAQLMSETIMGSVQKYDELQRLEAASRMATLQQALEQMNELSRQRGELLRTSSHDLRGSFGIINSAAYLLRMDDLSDQDRQQFMDMLSRNLTNMQAMLTNLMDLSRLEAGEEVLHIQEIDAAQLLRDIVESARPMANEQKLVIQADGPDSLLITTDSIKLQRIVQNLLLNSIKYTQAGFISISWSREGDMRWTFSIQDSGPGLPGALTKQLKPTVEPTNVMGPEQGEPVAVLPSDEHELPAGPQLAQQVSRGGQGEGVGLQIVKRLCELIEATLDIETREGRGTLFRIRMPIRQGS